MDSIYICHSCSSIQYIVNEETYPIFNCITYSSTYILCAACTCAKNILIKPERITKHIDFVELLYKK